MPENIGKHTQLQLAKLKEGSTNAPLPLPPAIANIPMFQTTSVPETEDQGTTTGTCSSIIFGNFNNLYIGVRMETTVELLPNVFGENYQYGILAATRIDVLPYHEESFCRLSGIALS